MKLNEINSLGTLKRAITREYCLICCGTSWSLPCRKQYLIVQRLARKHIGRDCIAILDIEKYPDAAIALTIQSIPTTIVFNRGKEAGRLVGLKSGRTLHTALHQVVPTGLADQFRTPTETKKVQSK